MKVDIEKLKQGLEQLTGVEHMAAEKEARRRGANVIEINFSKCFQAVVAAKALGVSYEEIANLKVKDFVLVTITVFAFLESSEDGTPLREEIQ